MTTRYPIAYVRRSSADAESPGDVSREAQEAAIRDLAHRDGHNGNLRVLVDWDRSADDAKESKRTGYVALLAAIEAGEVDAVYAASLDRLYRSIRTFVRLTDAARTHGTRIVTAREGVLGGDGSPMAQAFAEITAVFAGLELRTAKTRAAGALAIRQARGDHIGRAGYGQKLARNEAGAIVTVPDPEHPLEPILDAVREAGSILGACKLLNERKVPVPGKPRTNGDRPIWHPTPLRRIIERNAPELVPPAGPSGRRTPTHSALAQLLTCHCGHVLTPEPARKGYRCTMGNRTGRDTHGAMWVSERAILPALQAEAAHLRVPGDAVKMAETVGGRSGAIRARLARYAELYAEGTIDRERYDTEKARANRDLAGLAAETTALAIPTAIDWTWSPETLNTVLRALWAEVRLDRTMHVVSIDWRVPEWRDVAPEGTLGHPDRLA